MTVLDLNLNEQFPELKKVPFIELHFFADEHIGDQNHDRRALLRRIEYVQNTPHAFACLNGDLLNNATTTSVSDSYSETLPPMEQLTECQALFAPIAEKILYMVPGNHELRTYRKEGIDISAIVADGLKIRRRYACGSVYVFLRFGAHRTVRPMLYQIYAKHGAGGSGRLAGGKLNKVIQMSDIVDADLYVHSHTHAPITYKGQFFRPNAQTRRVVPYTRLYVNTAANMKYGGYAEDMNLTPGAQTPIVVRLYNPTHYLEAVL